MYPFDGLSGSLTSGSNLDVSGGNREAAYGLGGPEGTVVNEVRLDGSEKLLDSGLGKALFGA